MGRPAAVICPRPSKWTEVPLRVREAFHRGTSASRWRGWPQSIVQSQAHRITTCCRRTADCEADSCCQTATWVACVAAAACMQLSSARACALPHRPAALSVTTAPACLQQSSPTAGHAPPCPPPLAQQHWHRPELAESSCLGPQLYRPPLPNSIDIDLCWLHAAV